MRIMFTPLLTTCLTLVLLASSAGRLSAGALSLDGIDDIVTFPGTGIPSGNNPFTIEVWINPDGPTTGQDGGEMTFWGNQSGNQANGFRLRGPSGTRHFFWGNDHDVSFGISIIPDNTGPNADGWHHVAITYDGAQTRWYWNGSILGTPRTANAGVNVVAANHRIGSRLGAEFFDGFMDELRIWSVARSEAELSANMGQALAGSEPDLVAYWDFEGNFGDRAGGNNNGVSVGGALINAGVNAPIQTAGPRITSFTASAPQVFETETLALSWEVDDTDVTGSLTVEILDQGGVLHTSSSATGSFPIVIGDTGGVSDTVTYTLRASESGGEMISREDTVEVELLPGRPIADPQLDLETGATTPLPITLTGSDPNNRPNPQLTYTIVTPPSHGSLTGTAPNLTYTANGGFFGPDSFTFRVNDGKYDSTPATVAINVVALPAAPTDIVLSSSNIGETTPVGGFVATLRSEDPNAGDTHNYSLVAGAGDTDNGLFTLDGNQLRTDADFFGQVGNSYSIRVRSTDSGDLWFEKSFILTVIEVSGDLVINEIHYNPPDNTVRQEFIEIYNPGQAVADLTGWRLSSAVDYLFPEGTSIPPDGYLVVAEDPPTILATFGVNALGPYTGSLDADGEIVRLRDALDRVVDEVDYSVGFPWPVESNGNGPSIELIHPGLNNSHGSSWRASGNPGGGVYGLPTPGLENSVFSLNAPPSIRRVDHSPKQPAAAEPTVITAEVTDPDLVALVTLEYQTVAPGAYIPAFLPHTVSGGRIINYTQPRQANPAYNDLANWTTVTMNDDGLDGDEVAGDDIFTVTLPGQAHRTMVRYRITVEDEAGLSAQVPYPDDLRLNFAYFVYDGVPDYNGHAAETLTTLPVYHVITRAEDWSQCYAWNGAFQIGQGGEDRFFYNWNGTIVYDGVVYDNIRYRLRGANGRYHQAGKRSMRFRLNEGDYFQARDQDGKKFSRKWRTLTTTKGFENRQTLTYALNEAINMHLWDSIGLPAQETFWMHFRVIDGAEEAPDRWRGDFWGLNFVVETYDIQFMERKGLPKGSLYKLINQTTSAAQQLRYQGAFAPRNGEDHDDIERDLTGNSTVDYIRARVDVEKYYLYHSLSEAIRNYDFWPSANKNMVYYFYPNYTPANNNRGQLWILPWDSDASWGPTWNEGHDVVYNSIFPANGAGSDSASTPELWPGYYNAVRQLRDLVWQEDQLNPVIDHFASIIADFIPADSDRWKGAPADAGNYGTLGGQGIISLEALVQDLKNFAFVGGSWPGGGVIAGGRAAHLDTLQGARGEGALIPATPTIDYVGAPGFPVDGIFLQSSDFSDPQGPGTFGAMEWRVAQIENTNAPGYVLKGKPRLEWEAEWVSGEITSFSDTIQVPPVRLEGGKTYRARVRHRDNTGRWSHWSAPLRFRTVAADVLGDLQTALVVSEIMYNPPAAGGFHGDDLEWLELRNIGNTTLNLSGLFFDAGIEFVFAEGTMLTPGQFFVLVRDAIAFSVMNPGVVVGGDYSGKLDNDGETLVIQHPHGVRVLSFTYGDRAPWPVAPDGLGFSLVRDPVTGGYRASSQLGGFPGQVGPGSSIPTVIINEILSASTPPAVDVIELFNPGSRAADLSGWYLTDDPIIPKKYRIPNGTILEGGVHFIFDETQFNPTPGIGTSFSLSSAGDEVYLFSGNAESELTGYSHGFEIGGSARDATFGLYINSVGEEQLPAQINPTLPGSNSGPSVGPVVISEIMYHPVSDGVEFVELQNISGSTVLLYDLNATSNTWRLNGAGFDFPTGVSLDPGEVLLIVENDPSVFRAAEGVPASVQIFGPMSGSLQNEGERLQLQQPSPPGAALYYITVDGVRYNDKLPWAPAADGAGASLHRLNPSQYGDDPINWDAAVPTPGSGLGTGTPPTITDPPTDLVAVALSEATLSVGATGSGPLRYQWMFEGDSIDGGINPTLILPNVLPSNAGLYSVVVYNAAGSDTSDEVFLSVDLPAEITQQPQSVSVSPGGDVTLSVQASGTSFLRFQWKRNGIPRFGETSSTLLLPSIQPGDAGNYTVVVTDAVGSIESGIARVAVLVAPVVFPPRGSNRSVTNAVGGSVTFSVTVTNTATLPIHYTWRKGSLELPGGNRMLYAYTDFYTLSDLVGGNAGGYTCVTRNEAFTAPGFLSGTFNLAVIIPVDTDGDGMPDAYENANGLDAGDASDAGKDLDLDGVSNRGEFISMTDPQDPNSFLKIDEILDEGIIRLRFNGFGSLSYTIQFIDQLEGGVWQFLAGVASSSSLPVPRMIEVIDPQPPANGERYYRIVTPGVSSGE